MIPKVLIPDKAIKQFRHKLREMLAPSTYEHSVNAKILALNRLTQGWCEYYRSTNNPSKAFRMLDEELFWGMAHWLGRKYDTSIPTVMERFREGRTFGTKTRRLRMPGEYKAKRFIAKTWHNPYTETEKVAEEKDRIKREILFSYNIWTGYEHRHGGMDLREEVLLRDGPTCARCGETFHPFAVHVDHILARSRFKDPTEADNLENLQVLCPEHHKAKTKTDLKVLSRMR